jgi:hypothetical protein
MKFKILILLLLISGLSFAGDDVEGQLLKNPLLELTPFVGHYEQILQFKDGYRSNSANWKTYNWGALLQLKEKKSIVTIKSTFLTDKETLRTFHSRWLFSYDWRILKDENIFLQLKYFDDQPIEGTFSGHRFTAGFHYNNVLNSREFNDFINFYAQVNYVINGFDEFLIPPYYNDADFTGMIESVFGVVINLFDVLYFEQNMDVYTVPTGWITMTPQHSIFDTKIWLQFKNLRLQYKHSCYHTFEDKLDSFPVINGGMDYITLQYTFKWKHHYEFGL